MHIQPLIPSNRALVFSWRNSPPYSSSSSFFFFGSPQSRSDAGKPISSVRVFRTRHRDSTQEIISKSWSAFNLHNLRLLSGGHWKALGGGAGSSSSSLRRSTEKDSAPIRPKHCTRQHCCSGRWWVNFPSSQGNSIPPDKSSCRFSPLRAYRSGPRESWGERWR